MADDLPDREGEDPNVVERGDGSLLIDGMMPVHAAFDRLKLRSGIVNLSHLAQKDGNFCSHGTSHWGILDHVEAGICKKIAQIDVLVGQVDSAH